MQKQKLFFFLGSLCLIVFILSSCGKEKASNFYKNGMELMEKEEYEQAVAAFKKAVEKKTDKAEYYIAYAYALIQNENSEEALIQFNKAYSNKDNQIVRENNKKIFRGRGIAYMELNQYEDAYKEFEKALAVDELNDMDSDIEHYLGEAYLKAGEQEKAVKTYTKIIEKKKSDAEAYGRRADAYAALGKIEEARKDYDAAIKLDATNFSFYFGKYNILREAGEDKAAEETLTAAYSLQTKTPRDYYNLAIIHYLSGDLDVAATSFGDSLANGFTEANYYLGRIYQEKGDTKNALYYYEQYLNSGVKITSAAVYAGLAGCYIKNGDFAKAEDMVEKGLGLNDRDYEKQLLYLRVALLEQNGDYSKAAQVAEEYVGLYPQDEKMQKELTFLRTRVK